MADELNRCQHAESEAEFRDGSYFRIGDSGPHYPACCTIGGMEECNHTLLDAIDIIGVALISYMALTPVFVFLTVLFDEKRIMVSVAANDAPGWRRHWNQAAGSRWRRKDFLGMVQAESAAVVQRGVRMSMLEKVPPGPAA